MPGRPTERRAFLGTLVDGLLARPLAAAAQQPGKIFRVGHLAASTPSAENTKLLGAFQGELRERGWVEGRNIAFEYRWAEGRYERLPGLAAELAESRVSLIVAGGTPNALAAHKVSIVMVGATTPAEVGLVKTLARLGGNVTGVTFDVSPEQTAKLVELLGEIPTVSRVAVLWSRGYPARTGTGVPSSGRPPRASGASASSRCSSPRTSTPRSPRSDGCPSRA